MLKTCVLGVSLAALAAGCSTTLVQSYGAPDTKENASYLTYAIARSMIVVELAEAKAAASGGKSGESEAAGAAGQNVNVEVTIAGEPQEPKPTPAPKPADKPPAKPEEKSACDKVKEAYAPLVGQGFDFKLAGNTARGVLEKPGLTDPLTAAQQAEALGVLETFAALLPAEESRRSRANALLATAKAACPQRALKVTLTHETVPSEVSFKLRYQPNWLSADKLDFKVGPDGMLISASTTAKDATTEAFTAAGKLIGTFLAPLPKIPSLGGFDSAVDSPPVFSAGSCNNLGRAGTFAQRVKLLNGKPQCIDVAVMRSLGREIGELTEAETPSIEPPPLPPAQRYTLEQLSGKNGVTLEGVVIQAQCSTPSGLPISALVTPGVSDGLVASSATSCRIQAKSSGQTGTFLADKQIWAQDPTRIVQLPLERSWLTTRTMTYTFANGQPASVVDDQQSPVAALLGLPGAIVGGVVAGYKDASTSQKDITSAKTEEVKAQTDLVKAQTDLIKAQEAARAAAKAAEDAEAVPGEQ